MSSSFPAGISAIKKTPKTILIFDVFLYLHGIMPIVNFQPTPESNFLPEKLLHKISSTINLAQYIVIVKPILLYIVFS